MDTIAETPFTVDWIVQQIVKKTGVENAQLKSHKDTRIGLGQGYMSTVMRINLEWEHSEGLPSVVVLKVPTMTSIEAAMKDMVVEENKNEMSDQMSNFIPVMHNNECAAYEIFSLLKSPPLPIPVIYGWQTMQSVKEPGAVLMEDFSERHAAIVNKADGLTFGQVTSLVEALAATYAWAIESDQSFQNKFTLMNDLDSADMMTPMVQKMMTDNPETFEGLTLDKLVMTIDYMKIWYSGENLPAKFFNLPPALVQGDMWTNNILFRREAPSHDAPISDDLFAVIDWQTAHPGTVTEDLARLLISSFPHQLRREHTKHFIHTFYERVKYLLKTPPTFTEKDLTNAYNFNFHIATAVYMMSVGLMLHNPAIVGEEGTDTCAQRQKELLGRAAAALEDSAEIEPFVIETMKNII